ncbi:MAG: orotate phosphoribosyltransferase [Cytophagaceae bacterium SCN 52-12]|nr:MAG: orotate phosphoribosyltransferase [Cytophagaceae bacterium SCN 52-12]
MDTQFVSRKIAEKLLEIEAIKLSPDSPFRWSSGWMSPIYCDNRVALSYPDIRTYIKEALADKINEKFPDVEVISGVATAGIAQGALVADKLGLPFGYVRPEPKKHGMGNQIEGPVPAGKKVVVVEDLISTGGSSLKAVRALTDHGAIVVGTIAIFSYGFEVAKESFLTAGIPLEVLSHYEILIDAALEKAYISADQIEVLNNWRLSPETWGK